jgi:hypothetical protein
MPTLLRPIEEVANLTRQLAQLAPSRQALANPQF